MSSLGDAGSHAEVHHWWIDEVGHYACILEVWGRVRARRNAGGPQAGASRELEGALLRMI